MKINFGIILLLLIRFKSAMSDLERELRISIDKAMQCDRREPPKEPVIAMSPKRFSQLVGLLRNDVGPPTCDKSGHHPPFRLEDPSTWGFCVFGTCRNNRCECFKSYSGPSCAVHSSDCWLMYCFLTTCHSSAQSFNCKCDTKLLGTKVKTHEYWYDEGKQHAYKPPPPGWKGGIAYGPNAPSQKLAHEYWYDEGKQHAYKPPPPDWRGGIAYGPKAPSQKLGLDVWVPLGKSETGGIRTSNSNQQQGLNPQHGQIQAGGAQANLQQFNQNGGQPNSHQSQQHQPHGGQIQGGANTRQFGHSLQNQQHPQGGQIQAGGNNGQFGNSFQNQQHLQNGNPNFSNGQGNLQGATGNQRVPGSSGHNSQSGSYGSRGNNAEDTTDDDIEEALEEMTEEPASAISLFGEEYILCFVMFILSYGYQYILNI